jgi:hypothetical protein
MRYYVELSNRQQELLDGQPLRDLGPDCQECLRIARQYDEVAAAGHRYEGGELSVTGVAAPQVQGNEAVISFGVRQEAVRLVDAVGNPVDTGLDMLPDLDSGMTLTWSDREACWLVEGLNFG